MNPGSGSFKLDSALKRRFSILEFGPDYTALALNFGITEQPLGNAPINTLDNDGIKNLAVVFLRKVNEKLKQYIGTYSQIGQAAFWDLNQNCSFEKFCTLIDERILPVLEDHCVDKEIAQTIFGNDNPLVHSYEFGVEVSRLSTLSDDEKIKAIGGILGNA